MKRITPIVLTLAALVGCSSGPSAKSTKKAEVVLDKIQGKAQTLTEPSAADMALNAGGDSIYIWQGARRYRLFLRTPAAVEHGKYYVVEGIDAQKAIDEIGDPDQGKNGYPLLSSCDRVTKMVWSNLAFDSAEAAALRVKVNRYPARHVFLVSKIRPATDIETTAMAKTEEPEEKNAPEVNVPAEKQAALLVEGSPVQTAPLWDTKTQSIKCKVVIGTDGKVDELETGAQLCEYFDWAQLRYKPTVKAGKPAKVSTEIEVKFEPRKAAATN